MINLNDKYRIARFDENNLVLQKFDKTCKKNGTVEKKWKFVGYYSSLKSAFEGVLKHNLMQTPEEELELKQVIDCINTMLVNLAQSLTSQEEIKASERKKIAKLIRREFCDNMDYKNFGIPVNTLDKFLDKLMEEENNE